MVAQVALRVAAPNLPISGTIRPPADITASELSPSSSINSFQPSQTDFVTAVGFCSSQAGAGVAPGSQATTRFSTRRDHGRAALAVLLALLRLRC